MIDRWTVAMLEGVTTDGETFGPAEQIVEGGVPALEEVVEFQFAKNSEILYSVYEIDREKEKLEAELLVVLSKLSELVPGGPSPRELEKYMNWVRGMADSETFRSQQRMYFSIRKTVTHDLTVLVTIDDEGLRKHKESSEDFELIISYIVSRAHWKPSYDWRLNSENSKATLIYFASAEQCCGEDWSDVELTLSTGSGMSGSTSPPELPTSKLDAKPPEPPRLVPKHVSASLMLCSAPSQEPSGVRRAFASGVSAAGHTTYTIARKCTLNSETKKHKVIIGEIELDASLTYFGVPSKGTQVFIQSTAVNSSPYTLLKSNQASVYLDGSFLCKAEIDHIAPGEKFAAFLGVDPSVRIESHKENRVIKESGLISRTKVLTVSATTALYNAKQNKSVRLVIAQQLPRTRDDKVKVKCVEPTQESWTLVSAAQDHLALDAAMIPDGRDAVLFNRTTHNLLWCYTISPGRRLTVPFSYTMEYPNDKELEMDKE